MAAAGAVFAKAGPEVTSKVVRAAQSAKKRFADAAAGVAIVLGELSD